MGCTTNPPDQRTVRRGGRHARSSVGIRHTLRRHRPIYGYWGLCPFGSMRLDFQWASVPCCPMMEHLWDSKNDTISFTGSNLLTSIFEFVGIQQQHCEPHPDSQWRTAPLASALAQIATVRIIGSDQR
jgi:hypothetical protein